MSGYGQNQVRVLDGESFSRGSGGFGGSGLERTESLGGEIILFYYKPGEEIVGQWGSEVAVKSIFPYFGVVHVPSFISIQKSINDILKDINNPLAMALNSKTTNSPFVLYYRKGKISEIYSGPLSPDSLITYSLQKSTS